MGPVFYLVQSKEALRLISAMLLGNWPHEFALALLPGKGGLRPRPPALPAAAFPARGGLRRSEKSLARNSRHLTVRALLLCAVSDQVVDLLRRQLRQIGTSNR